ncbi:hypothetical protein [Algivirga pacifica]|uniref:Uncharacterized protein n=1 Tax=Algivirga pacifica TaxID=1162670 RepID=A0ABP9DHN9_9BACT
MINFIKKLFSSRYEVVFRMYEVIPGRPVKANEKKFKFEKGADIEAKAFYDKVLASLMENKLSPSEVVLLKGRKAIQSKEFGPVAELKKLAA